MLHSQTTCRRRSFLRSLAVGSVATSLPIGVFASALPRHNIKLRLDQVNLNDFSPHLNSTFLLTTASGAEVHLRLVEATGLSPSGPARPAHLSQRAPFSLVFLAAANSGLQQQIYRLQHPALGDLEIFLVPIGMDGGTLKLEAIFN